MIDLLTPATILSFVTTVISLIGMKLIGDKNAAGFYLSIANQSLWFALALATGAYGLLPMCFIYTAVYVRNIKKWRSANVSAGA